MTCVTRGTPLHGSSGRPRGAALRPLARYKIDARLRQTSRPPSPSAVPRAARVPRANGIKGDCHQYAADRAAEVAGPTDTGQEAERTIENDGERQPLAEVPHQVRLKMLPILNQPDHQRGHDAPSGPGSAG